jgi:hypothetical protein
MNARNLNAELDRLETRFADCCAIADLKRLVA